VSLCEERDDFPKPVLALGIHAGNQRQANEHRSSLIVSVLLSSFAADDLRV
jgi:hypothetical protein